MCSLYPNLLYNAHQDCTLYLHPDLNRDSRRNCILSAACLPFHHAGIDFEVCLSLVPAERFELSHPKVLVPKTNASAVPPRRHVPVRVVRIPTGTIQL